MTKIQYRDAIDWGQVVRTKKMGDKVDKKETHAGDG